MESEEKVTEYAEFNEYNMLLLEKLAECEDAEERKSLLNEFITSNMRAIEKTVRKLARYELYNAIDTDDIRNEVILICLEKFSKDAKEGSYDLYFFKNVSRIAEDALVKTGSEFSVSRSSIMRRSREDRLADLPVTIRLVDGCLTDGSFMDSSSKSPFSSSADLESIDCRLDWEIAEKGLSERERQSLMMYHGAGYSRREIAEELGISVRMVDYALAKGLEKSRQNLGISL